MGVWFDAVRSLDEGGLSEKESFRRLLGLFAAVPEKDPDRRELEQAAVRMLGEPQKASADSSLAQRMEPIRDGLLADLMTAEYGRGQAFSYGAASYYYRGFARLRDYYRTLDPQADLMDVLSGDATQKRYLENCTKTVSGAENGGPEHKNERRELDYIDRQRSRFAGEAFGPGTESLADQMEWTPREALLRRTDYLERLSGVSRSLRENAADTGFGQLREKTGALCERLGCFSETWKNGAPLKDRKTFAQGLDALTKDMNDYLKQGGLGRLSSEGQLCMDEVKYAVLLTDRQKKAESHRREPERSAVRRDTAQKTDFAELSRQEQRADHRKRRPGEKTPGRSVTAARGCGKIR